MPRSLPRVILVLIPLLLSAHSAIAQKEYTYTPEGPIMIYAADGKWAYNDDLVVTNHSDSLLTLYFYFSGDTTFKGIFAPLVVPLCAGCSTNIGMTFAANDHSLDSGLLSIWDKVNVPDTVRYYAQDTGVFPYRIDTAQLLAGSRFDLPNTAWVTVRNQWDKPIAVFAELISWASMGFTALQPVTQTIPAHGTATYYFEYDPVIYDTAYANVQFYGEQWIQKVKLSAARKKPTHDTLSWSGDPDFGPQKRGTTECRTYTIYNGFDSPAQISSIMISMNDNVFELENAPDLPFSLAAGDSFEVSVCFAALFPEGTGMGGGVRIAYQYQGDIARFAEIYLQGRTAQCIEVSPTMLEFGDVPMGTTATRSLTITNYSNNTVEVDSVIVWTFSPGFALASEKSFTIPEGESRSVQFSFTPVDVGGDSLRYSYIGIFTKGQCDYAGTLYLMANPVEAPLDSTLHDLFADSTQTLIFTGDSTIASESFRFINDLDDSIKVISVSLQNGEHFAINAISPQMPEFTLAPDSIMEVTLQFTGTPGTYEDTLVIVTEDAIVALTYRILANIQGSSVNAAVSQVPVMHITPNPSFGAVSVTFEHIRTSSIEVLDMLGTVIERLSADHWDANDVARGTYFVRATGVSLDGRPFVITQRVVIK